MTAASAHAGTAEPAPFSLGELYRAHASFVWRTLRRFGIADEALEDVVHDVFMIARRRLHEFDGESAPTTWLFVIARNVAANHRRARTRADKRRALAPVGKPPLDPEEALVRARAIAFIGEFLAELPAEQREVFELVDIEGLRGPEAAELLALNLNVLYSRLRLARRRLEAFIDARNHEGGSR